MESVENGISNVTELEVGRSGVTVVTVKSCNSNK